MKYRIEYTWTDGTTERSINTYDKVTAERKAQDNKMGSILSAATLLEIEESPESIASWELIPEA